MVTKCHLTCVQMKMFKNDEQGIDLDVVLSKGHLSRGYKVADTVVGRGDNDEDEDHGQAREPEEEGNQVPCPTSRSSEALSHEGG